MKSLLVKSDLNLSHLPFTEHATRYKVVFQNVFDMQCCSVGSKAENITRIYSTEMKFLRSIKGCISSVQQYSSA